MKKVLIIIGIAVIAVVGILFAVGAYLKSATKAFSPVETVSYQKEEATFEIIYCRPYKNERNIFGGLVPYNEVWRTGANEPTTFETKSNILIKDQPLEAGKYSLWTIPGEEEWQIIFNSEIPDWGVNFSGVALRNPKYDVVIATVPSWEGENVIEQFTITLEEMDDRLEMILMWDKTTVVVPINL